MRFFRRLIHIQAALAGMAWGGCTESSDACVAGTSEACMGADGCRGVIECVGDPPRPGRCTCAGDALLDGGDAAPHKLPLGRTCESDAECPSGGFCLAGNSGLVFGGTSAIGVCAADCTGDPGRCDAFDSAICVDVSAPEEAEGTRALCFEACAIGGGSAMKCHGVSNVVCDPFSDASGDEFSAEGFCRPVCVTDEDCPAQHCDRRYGVCRSQATSRTLPLGTPCDPAAEENDCEGLCVRLAEEVGLCSHRCKFGDTAECDAPDAPERAAGCLLVTPEGSLDDTGYCAPLCDQEAECAAPVNACELFLDAVLEQAFGRAGVCTAPD
jgi:hypothetical protein